MVEIFYEDISPLTLEPAFYIKWLTDVCKLEKSILGNVSLIFCSDNYLLKINQNYLNHDYFTDIITFDYSGDTISGDLFISYERVVENSKTHKTLLSDELNRVVVHGVLHLIGYKDKSASEEKKMRQLENKYLSIVPRETID